MSWLGSILNWPYKILMKAFIVPNTDADKRGLFNRIFAGLVPALERSKNLKETNLVAYKTLKYTVNTTLFVLLGLLVWGVISGVIWLVS
jgi:beta-hydroxylase